MKQVRCVWRGAAGAGVALAVALAGPGLGHSGRASASAQAPGTAGYCPDSTGVTVVVDMTALGGDVVVRCDPDPVRAGVTGVDALQAAGFSVTGTQRYGLAFICRIQGRPAADEALDVPGDPTYHEPCVDTPPQTAFWAYWYSPNHGSWTYSSVGADTREPISGGFEGWAFSLGDGTGSPPAPAVDPTRPVPPQPPSTTPPSPTTPAPTARPGHHHHDGSVPPPATTAPSSRVAAGPPTTSGPATTSPDSPTAPATTGTATRTGRTPGSGAPGHRRATRWGPAAPGASASGGDPTTSAAVRVTGELPDTAEAAPSSSGATLVGLGVLVLLGVGTGVTAWRRSHRP